MESCDIYFYKLGMRLGVDKIALYAKKFGLGKETGLDVGREKRGLIPTSQWKLKKFGVPWQAGETVSISIGQSFVLVTPIQMASMISTVFSGGVVHKPQVTKWAGKNGADRPYEFRPKLIRRLGIKQEHLELVKKILIDVVNKPRGTGSKARLKNATVAGKTGTAQVVTLKEGEDSHDKKEVPFELRDHAWFIAVAPAEKPRIALAVLVEHGGHGGSAAAPIAKEMIKAYLGVPD